MPLSDFLSVQVSTQAVAPQQAGFGVPLILGAAKAWGASTDKIRTYTGLAGMVSDGFATSDPEYLAAAAVWAQTPQLPKLVVGRRTLTPTQKFTITVLQAVSGKTYTVTVNGAAKSYTATGADTTSTIATALATAIGTPTGFGAASATAAAITITASAAGNFARISATNPNVDLDCQQTHVDAGIATDIGNIYNVDGGASWYAIISTFASNAEVAALAAWTESNGKLYLAGTQDSTVLGAGTGDVASTLKTSAYVRSPVFYHQDNGAFMEAALAGSRLSFSPGAETWKFAQLAGVAGQSFTATQIANLGNKNANYYYPVAGVNMSANGVTPSGQWIDTVRGRDWVVSRIQNRVYNILLNPPQNTNPTAPGSSAPPLGKVPFTDPGIAAVEAEVRAALQEGVNNGLIAASPAFSVTAPLASSVSASNKSQRILAPVSFSATLAGAIHGLTVTGVVSF